MSTEAAVLTSHAGSVEHAEPNYVAIFAYLTVLTIAELLVAYYVDVKPVRVGLLVALAWAKAAMVAMYFMHLRFERRALAVIALAPVALVSFLSFMLVPDLSSRVWARINQHQVVGHPAAQPAPAPQP
ncbi:MAG: cytochrome C oxidase subunit IV family protein [Candidatus Binataceae bacterium]